MARKIVKFNLSDLTATEAEERGLLNVWKEHQQKKIEKKFEKKA